MLNTEDCDLWTMKIYGVGMVKPPSGGPNCLFVWDEMVLRGIPV